MDGNGDGVARGDAEQRRLEERARELMELFEPHDRAGLARLSPGERREQLQARAALYHYAGWLYHDAKRREGLDPKYDPELAILGVYRNLTGVLGDAAVEISHELRDSKSTSATERQGHNAGRAQAQPMVQDPLPDPYHPWVERPIQEFLDTARYVGKKRRPLDAHVGRLVDQAVDELIAAFLPDQDARVPAQTWALYELSGAVTGRLRFDLALARTRGVGWSELAAWLDVPDAVVAWRLAAVPQGNQLVVSWGCPECQWSIHEIQPDTDGTAHYLDGHAPGCALTTA